jgi:flavin-dependent dehydrogenase
MSQNQFDVIIVGGRPSGSTLAARLGMAGLRVLLLERSRFPSPPGASCPIIYASTMRLLDEVGADEADYARNTPRIRRMVNATEDFHFAMTLPSVYGRDYAYALDRTRFDAALWDNALRFPTVTGREGFSVTDLLWDGERVVGVVGNEAGGATERFSAPLVVGADGRFSIVARKAKADGYDIVDTHPTSIYYAYWRGVTPYDDGSATAMAYAPHPGGGIGFLVMDSADGTAAVCVEGQTSRLEPDAGKAEAMYLRMLEQSPLLRQRLAHAERVTDVRGMRKVGNLYRQAGGAGWALVGDAYHQKDPIDGQGIYDAVFTAKALAQAITSWHNGEQTWEDALASYDREARTETFDIYQSTLNRIRTSLYNEPDELAPKWAMQMFNNRTLLRWVIEDPLCQEQMAMILTRQIKPKDVVSLPIFAGALLRGPLRDLSKRLDDVDRFLERLPQRQ